MTLLRANTLAFSLIGKDEPHRSIKICFGSMNLVFGSEVTLLGFWEYMFGILVTVQGPSFNHAGRNQSTRTNLYATFNSTYQPGALVLFLPLI